MKFISRRPVSATLVALVALSWSAPLLAQQQHVHAQSPAPPLNGPFFQLSVSPGGTAPVGKAGVGQPGTTGDYPASLYMDGTTRDDPTGRIDPQTGQVVQVNDVRRLSPDEKHYFVVVSATVTLADTVVPPSIVQAKARRIRYQYGMVQRVVGEEEASILLYLVTESDYGKPQRDLPNHAITYTYRTHDKEDTEAKPYRIAGSTDLKIDTWKGRWMFYIPRHPSNTVELKIDKRAQLTTYALDWVGYYSYKRDNAQDEAEFNKWNQMDHPDGLFHHCFSFVGHIYNRHGLTLPVRSDDPRTEENEKIEDKEVFGVATAPDDGPGSLRFFWGDTTPYAPTPANDPSHVAIIGPNTVLGYGTRVDNNGLPGGGGPTWRAKDEGEGNPGYFGDELTSPRRPKSQTLPGQNNPALSLLQELDGE